MIIIVGYPVMTNDRDNDRRRLAYYSRTPLYRRHGGAPIVRYNEDFGKTNTPL